MRKMIENIRWSPFLERAKFSPIDAYPPRLDKPNADCLFSTDVSRVWNISRPIGPTAGRDKVLALLHVSAFFIICCLANTDQTSSYFIPTNPLRQTNVFRMFRPGWGSDFFVFVSSSETNPANASRFLFSTFFFHIDHRPYTRDENEKTLRCGKKEDVVTKSNEPSTSRRTCMETDAAYINIRRKQPLVTIRRHIGQFGAIALPVELCEIQSSRTLHGQTSHGLARHLMGSRENSMVCS